MLKGMNGYVEEVDSDEDDHGTSINGKSPCNHDIRPRSPRSPGESFTYEHFPVVCPTCRGSGRVLEDDVNKLVAFVPVKDERLKPSRIFYKILLMFLAFACIAVPLGFFLIPRSVTMELLKSTSRNISIPLDSKQTPFIIVETGIKVVNDNYLKVKINKVELEVSWNCLILNTHTCQNLSMEVPARHFKEYPIQVKMRFTGAAGQNIRDDCLYGWKTHITQKFVATAKVSFLTQTSEISVTKYPYIQCYDYLVNGRRNIQFKK